MVEYALLRLTRKLRRWLEENKKEGREPRDACDVLVLILREKCDPVGEAGVPISASVMQPIFNREADQRGMTRRLGTRWIRRRSKMDVCHETSGTGLARTREHFLQHISIQQPLRNSVQSPSVCRDKALLDLRLSTTKRLMGSARLRRGGKNTSTTAKAWRHLSWTFEEAPLLAARVAREHLTGTLFDETEMEKEELRCTLLNGSAWSAERKYMRIYKGKCDIFFGIEHRLMRKEMVEQFNKAAKEGWRFAADAARITDEGAGSEDQTQTSGGVFVAVDSNLGAVVAEKEGVWVHVRWKRC